MYVPKQAIENIKFRPDLLRNEKANSRRIVVVDDVSLDKATVTACGETAINSRDTFAKIFFTSLSLSIFSWVA